MIKACAHCGTHKKVFISTTFEGSPAVHLCEPCYTLFMKLMQEARSLILKTFVRPEWEENNEPIGGNTDQA